MSEHIQFLQSFVIPTKAGIQHVMTDPPLPAFAGTSFAGGVSVRGTLTQALRG